MVTLVAAGQRDSRKGRNARTCLQEWTLGLWVSSARSPGARSCSVCPVLPAWHEAVASTQARPPHTALTVPAVTSSDHF